MLASGHLITMRFERAREILLSLPGAEEGFPFGPEVMVFKVGAKMFATLAYEELPARMNLKCEPARALELRERYASVIPGYHMNKKHWNTLTCDGSLSRALVVGLIEASYQLVVKALPIKVRESL